jgi:hypothetical protein
VTKPDHTAYRRLVQVTFTRLDDSRYLVAPEREHGPALLPRDGPGYDDRMPHDVAHFLVEEHYEIRLGVWGQLAAGGGGIFWPAPRDNTLSVRRRAQRIAGLGRADMARSEELVHVTIAAWERSIGRTGHWTGPVRSEVDATTLAGAVRRMDEIAQRWQALEDGESMTLTWPKSLSFNDASSHRGRRTTKRAAHRTRR